MFKMKEGSNRGKETNISAKSNTTRYCTLYHNCCHVCQYCPTTKKIYSTGPILDEFMVDEFCSSLSTIQQCEKRALSNWRFVKRLLIWGDALSRNEQSAVRNLKLIHLGNLSHSTSLTIAYIVFYASKRPDLV